MKTWKDSTSLLMNSSNPSIRYFTLKKIFDIPDGDERIVREKENIHRSQIVTSILNKQNENGFWGNRNDYQKRFTGTLWQLMTLLELGCDPGRSELQKAARYLLDIDFDNQKGFLVSWKGTPQAPCYQGQILWSLLMCNCYNDPRVDKIIEWISKNVEFHDGDTNVKNPDDMCLGSHTCIRATIPIIQSLILVPQKQRNSKVIKLINDGNEFLLLHHVYKRSHNLSKPISPYMTRLTFPNYYYPDLLQVLLLLVEQGITDNRMYEAIELLQSKQRENGFWKLQRQYNERKPGDLFPTLAEFGEKGTDSEWITFRAIYVLKMWYENLNKDVRLTTAST